MTFGDIEIDRVEVSFESNLSKEIIVRKLLTIFKDITRFKLTEILLTNSGTRIYTLYATGTNYRAVKAAEEFINSPAHK